MDTADRNNTIDTVVAVTSDLIQDWGLDLDAPIGAAGTLPVQEVGTRPSRALPYDLEVTMEVRPSSRTLALTFSSRGASGAVFHVYDERDLASIPRRYAVSAGKTLRDAIPLADGSDDYALFVLGPNGFHRRFAGTASTERASASATIAYDADAGLVPLHIERG